jgi:hypothetical protein
MWAQDIGCEWLYRLCREPRRMWRRYLIGNLEFAVIVVRQRIRRSLLDTFVQFVNEDRFAAELNELTLLRKSSLNILPNVTTRDLDGLTGRNFE